MLLAAFGVLLASGSPLVAQTNLLVNPGFEDGGGSFSGWFVAADGAEISTAAGDNIMRTGLAAAKMYGEFTQCPGNPQFDVGVVGQYFTPTVGKIYEFNGYSFVSSADTMPGDFTTACASNRMIAKIVFFDAVEGGNEIQSNEVIIGNFATPHDEWIPFSVSAPAPAGALRVEALLIFLQPACDEGAVFVDDTELFELDPPAPPANLLANPSFDADLTGWVTFANVYYDGRNWARRTAPGAAKLYGAFGAPGDASGMYQAFAATSGTEYKMEIYSMTTCVESPLTGLNDNFATAKIVFLDAGEAEVGFAEVVIADSAMALGTWTHYSVSGTAPEGTVSVRSYILFIQPTSMGGAIWVDDVAFYEVEITADTPEPLNFELSQNVPNPFNPMTRIDFHLKSADNVKLEVYDVAGRHISTLHRGHLEAGPHSVSWNGRADNGTTAASGVYWYVLETSTGMESKRMVLLR
jgi:hypothetical protein